MTKKTEHRETKQNVKKEGEKKKKKSFKEDKASVKELVFPEERRCPPCRCY
jgi:hypothetical protein